MKYYGNKFKTTKGSGIRKQKGGNVLFFNNPKQLPKKLELIVGEIALMATVINRNEKYGSYYFRDTVESISN